MGAGRLIVSDVPVGTKFILKRSGKRYFKVREKPPYHAQVLPVGWAHQMPPPYHLHNSCHVIDISITK